MDFVDGRTENRNVGEFSHSCVLGQAMFLLGQQEKDHGTKVLPTCRLRVSDQRIRVPDVMVLEAGHPRERIITMPPAICIEVISPDDTWHRLRNLFTDFWTMGVRNIWAFEPEDRLAFRFYTDGLHPVRDAELVTLNSRIRLNVASVFRRLDSNQPKA